MNLVDVSPEQLRRDPAAFADAILRRNEKGQPWSLTAYQRRVLSLAFRWSEAGRLLIRLLLWSEPKKSGKTFLAAVLGLWWGFVTPHTEIIVVANDLEQAVGRVFRTMVALIRANPALKTYITIRASELQFTNGTVVTAIASEYRGAAGSRHSLVIFDELWGFSSENAERLYEELTPPPTEANAWVLIVTYAGFVGESKLLESLYQRGLAGERIDEELEVYRADELLTFWSHSPRQPWQTEHYYAEQRRSLRPSTFARLHENRWTSAESAFVTAEAWDACVEPSWSPLEPTREHPLWIGVDASTKRDSTAVVAVLRDAEDDLVVLARHRIWQPTPTCPLDFAAVEAFLVELAAQYDLARVVCDPYQFAGSMQRLRARGMLVEEYPQTEDRLTRMGQTLYDLIRERRLIAYPCDELRAHALAATAKETAHGFRITKDRTAQKIDAFVALGMAAHAAMTAPVPVPLELLPLGG